MMTWYESSYHRNKAPGEQGTEQLTTRFFEYPDSQATSSPSFYKPGSYPVDVTITAGRENWRGEASPERCSTRLSLVSWSLAR